MYEIEKELLIRLCQKSNDARQAALSDELQSRGIRYENWNNMALVVPSAAEKVIIQLILQRGILHAITLALILRVHVFGRVRNMLKSMDCPM